MGEKDISLARPGRRGDSRGDQQDSGSLPTPSCVQRSAILVTHDRLPGLPWVAPTTLALQMGSVELATCQPGRAARAGVSLRSPAERDDGEGDAGRAVLVEEDPEGIDLDLRDYGRF